MEIVYVVVTVVAAVVTGFAAVLSFGGAESVKAVADRVQVSQRWMVPFGVLLGCGAVGLLVGMAVPVLGTAAAVGLVLYFVCAVAAHVRAHDKGMGGALFFLALAVAALVTEVTYREPW